MPYRVQQPSVAPTWLQGTNATAWIQEFGGSKDAIVADLKAAVKCRFPEYAPADALPLIGQERQIDRGPTDTDQIYAQRLLDAWVTWSRGGMPIGLLLALEVAGYTDVALVQQAQNGYTLDADTTLDAFERLQITTLGMSRGEPGWLFDYNSGLPPSQGFWSRFGVIFNAPLPASWTSIVNPPTDGSAPTRSEVNGIRRIIRKWKPSKASCFGIYVVTGGKILGWPVRNLGNTNGVLGGTTVVWSAVEN